MYEAKEILQVIGVTGIDTVEISSYKLKDVTHIWFTQLKYIRSVNATFVTWDYFT